MIIVKHQDPQDEQESQHEIQIEHQDPNKEQDEDLDKEALGKSIVIMLDLGTLIEKAKQEQQNGLQHLA